MAHAFSPHQLAIPGPSVVPERVLRAMHRPSPNIYEGEIITLTESVLADLKRVARTSAADAAIYIANGHGMWEASLRNVVAPGDRVLVLNTGVFASGWGGMAEAMGVDVDEIDFGLRAAVDLDRVRDTLVADHARTFKAVLMVQTDTASSVCNDIAGVRNALDEAGHPALLMVDCIACLACDPFEMDAWGVDVMIAGSQKGLMTPAGIGFIFANEKARAARKGLAPGQYWDWDRRFDPELFYHRFCGTPPTHHLFGLREALTMIVHEEGLEAVWQRHRKIASAIWDAVDVWGDHGGMRHNISERALRSTAVSAVTMDGGNGLKIRSWCEDHGGITLGIGLGMASADSDDYANYFRIGHMGHQSVGSTMAVLGAIEAAMEAHDIARGSGALEAAARALSQASAPVTQRGPEQARGG